MKRSNTITTIASLMIFSALLVYIGVYLVRSVNNPIQTALAVVSTVRETGAASGIIIRDEQVIESSSEYINITTSEGKRVSKDSVIAVAYSSDAALERTNRIRELELEIQRAETLLSSLATAEDLTSRENAVRSAVLGLSAAIARHDLSELDSSSLNLCSLVFDSGGEAVTHGQLAFLKAELSSLKNSSSSDTSEILAKSSGLFSKILDGYEHLGASSLNNYKPSQLRELMQTKSEVSDHAIGKMISSYEWLFASIMPEEDAARLSEGSYATIEFGRYYSSPLSVKVKSIGNPEDGECVVVFSCKEALADTLAMRQVSADVIFDEFTGIRVPKKAVHLETSESGNDYLYVYTVTGMQAEKKYVEIVYDAGEYYLMNPVPRPGESSLSITETAAYLREGNKIIISGKDLFDGKVLG